MGKQGHKTKLLTLVWLHFMCISFTATLEQPEMIRFATKTAYQASFGNGSRQLRVDLNYPEWCVPIQVNAVIRHGIRNPGSSDIESFRALLDAVKPEPGNRLHEVMDWMARTLEAHKPKSLLEEGRVEQTLLAERIAEKFPNLFQEAELDDIKFVASTSQRTIDSCEAFQEGLLKKNVTFTSHIEINDHLIRFFDSCFKYLTEVEENKNALEQYRLFKDMHYSSVADSIRHRLSSSSIPNLHRRVKALYVMAGIEYALRGSQHLANVFTEETLAIMEYAADLKNYWKKSYGHAINYQQSCPLLEDILNSLRDASTNSGSYKAIFRFAHAETLLPLMALLGLHLDNHPLRADNYDFHRERVFRTTEIMPFTSNLAFVLYRCQQPPDDVTLRPSSDWPREWSPYMVQLLFKEQPFQIPGCDHLWCSLEALINYYQEVKSACDFNRICSKDDTPKHDDL